MGCLRRSRRPKPSSSDPALPAAVLAEPSRTTARDLVRATDSAVPRVDAEFLLMSLLNMQRHDLYSGTALPLAAVRRFRRLVARARTGEPVQYLVHSAPFLDLDLYVDHRVLIPRPETEELVLRAIARLRLSQAPVSLTTRPLLLDFGTGSGCIAIALALRIPKARVVAVDASRAALAVARRNVERHRLSGRVRLLHARSLADPRIRRCRAFDLIVANPPYVPTRRLAKLAPRVRDYEPKISLDGGPNGANIVAMILEQGPALLRPGGTLAMEIDATQRQFVLDNRPGAVVESDLASRPRYVFWHKSEHPGGSS
jgi:release factor glutamine methyltransferase